MLINSIRKQLWIPLALVMSLIILVWRAPVEQSLGQGIKIVYVHVGLIWAAMLGFAINGLLGLAVAITNNKKLAAWMETIGRVTLGVFVTSVLVSLLAEVVNWGGIFWQEPRNMAVFAVTAVAVIVLVLQSWLPWRRVHGLLHLGLAAYVFLTLPSAAMVMHPENPGRSSGSLGIQSAFWGTAVLAFLIGVWFVVYFRTEEAT